MPAPTSLALLFYPNSSIFHIFSPLGHFRFFDPGFFAFLSDFSIGPFPAPFFAAAFFMWRVWLGCSICVVNYEKAKSHSSFLLLLLFSSFPPPRPLKGRVGASPPFPPFNLLTAVSHYPRVPPLEIFQQRTHCAEISFARYLKLIIYSMSNMLQSSNTFSLGKQSICFSYCK